MVTLPKASLRQLPKGSFQTLSLQLHPCKGSLTHEYLLGGTGTASAATSEELLGCSCSSPWLSYRKGSISRDAVEAVVAMIEEVAVVVTVAVAVAVAVAVVTIMVDFVALSMHMNSSSSCNPTSLQFV